MIVAKESHPRFVPGETGIICYICNFPILMESFEWESEFKQCYNCKTHNKTKGNDHATGV